MGDRRKSKKRSASDRTEKPVARDRQSLSELGHEHFAFTLLHLCERACASPSPRSIAFAAHRTACSRFIPVDVVRSRQSLSVAVPGRPRLAATPHTAAGHLRRRRLQASPPLQPRRSSLISFHTLTPSPFISCRSYGLARILHCVASSTAIDRLARHVLERLALRPGRAGHDLRAPHQVRPPAIEAALTLCSALFSLSPQPSHGLLTPPPSPPSKSQSPPVLIEFIVRHRPRAAFSSSPT